MKSSSLHRSNLSKERMILLEGLKGKHKEEIEAGLNEYYRPGREKELDILWQNFKSSSKEERTPAVYLAVGFIAGAMAVLLMVAIFVLSTKPTANSDISKADKFSISKQASSVEIVPADTTAEFSRLEQYTVKNGDTLDSIVVRFYGNYDVDKIKAIQKLNNMSSPDMLYIGQTLSIPIE